MTMTENELKDGRVVGIAGPVIDVEFPRNALPEINTALEGLTYTPNGGYNGVDTLTITTNDHQGK